MIKTLFGAVNGVVMSASTAVTAVSVAVSTAVCVAIVR